ncbi:serine protease Do [Marinimicrobium koreense]|uniref:Probable periplasmic serine endoprotease DegP-like n=1 Tax=Marinimicrobium koreense TaxID=306545 RepID=A0A3N1NYP9_9GAMM|nr:DegQ family serine endoprotease [Marinimicrobium koreense]ROQ20521.1 serine protease Do [Marinimicrobium koreense]
MPHTKVSRSPLAVYLMSLVCLFALALPAQARDLPDFTELVEAHSPAVVKITTQGRVETGNRIPYQEDIPDMFREFFERRMPQERDVRSMGSGFVISEDGYILTNYHVIENADNIYVRLIDRREYTAEVIGTDARSDLALLKVDADDLPYLRFADSDSVKVGEWVLAIGSPFGLDYSVSSGIISAIGRSIPGPNNDTYVPFIQTDVAINPGNSGGPLFNLDGEVVGINSQIYTRSGGSIGLSFAIPAGLAKEVVAQLKDKGRVERGWLGVVIQGVNRDLAQSFGLRRATGALISNMDPEGPAARSGLEVGDIILKFDGRTIGESGDLPPLVGRTEPGSEVPVVVMRRGDERTIDVEIGLLPDRDGQVADSGPDAAPTGDPLGLMVEALPSDAQETGVLVTRVTRGSAAAGAGLRPGDIITQLGYDSVDSVSRYRALVSDLPKNKPVAVRFLRDGQPAFTTLRIE